MILNEPLATFEREALETYPFIDVVIRQEEREYVLEQVLSELEKDIRCREFEFPGVIYRDAAGEIKDNGQCPPFKNLHHLVSSSKFLLKEKEKAVFSHYDQAFVEVGRGCPYQCDFCFYNNTRYRTRGIEDIIDELKVIEGHFTHIWLHDLNMLVHKKFTRQLCEAIIENNVKVRWGTDVRLELLNDPDLLQLMNKAGCYLLVAGFESGDENVLKNIHKGKNFDYLDMGLKYCQMADITLSLNLMIGFPWEDDEALRKTERFAQEYYIGFIQYVRPLRGTPLYDKYKHLGLIDRDLTIEDYKN
ncbi:MAG: radical SAM protein, partial [bacterium]|nr:radical SAM protein [bacterium]